jgi:TatA/E family protein of Tat protein translocase
MGPLGWQETIFIFLLALLIFGPKKLPELGKTIGKAMTEFRRASSELKSTFDREMRNLERETEPIREETNKIAYDTYNYDSSYPYDAYSTENGTYSSSSESTAAGQGESTATDTSTSSASATQGAELTAEAAAPEGTIANSNPPGTTRAEPEPDPEANKTVGI